jgi:hypothetical protein
VDPIAFVAIVLGGIICFFGYPMINSAIRVWGFVIAGAGCVLAAVGLFHVPGSLTNLTLQMGVIFVVGGIVGAIIAGPLSILIIFFSGTALGALIGAYGYPLVTRGAENTLLTVILALFTGLLAARFQEVVLIVTTAFVGAAMMIYGIRAMSAMEILPALAVFFVAGFFGAAAQYKSLNPGISVFRF